jgi:uncharacterized protein DUF6894
VPRYFFRIHDNGSDDVEMNYSSAQNMRSDALRLAGESIQDMRFQTPNNAGWSLNVTDESDQVVFSLSVTLTDVY